MKSSEIKAQSKQSRRCVAQNLTIYLADNLITRTTKRTMRIAYNSDSEETLDALLQRDGA